MRSNQVHQKGCRRLLMAGLLAALWLAGATGPVRALPPPLSAEELQKRSDVVAVVRVLAVTCTAQAPDAETKQPLRTFQAWLQVVRVDKGNAKPDETITLEWRETPKGGFADGATPFFPGEEVKTYLKWIGDRRLFEVAGVGGLKEPIRPADIQKLPEKPGQVLVAKTLTQAPLTRNDALEAMFADLREIYPELDLSRYQFKVTLHPDGWHVDYEFKDPNRLGGGPRYVIDPLTGKIVSKRFEQ